MQNSLLNGIVLAPLSGALILGLITLSKAHKKDKLPEPIISIIACLGPLIACLISVLLFLPLMSDHHLIIHSHLLSWIKTSEVNIQLAFMMDHLSGLLVVMITFVGSLIHIFSIGYMKKDTGFARYFAYLNLFLAAMLILILSDNLVGMFLGWEGVGVCSYLLIGFWFKDIKKSAAGTKAFIVNRIGDFGFILGIFLIFSHTGTLTYTNLASAPMDSEYLTLICLLLFIGAMGKSAQLPLHVWLPDAMAGPTPVSALIHAATMVTAGVYMVARLHFFYENSPLVSMFIVSIGALTALMAATIALVQEDIKKVLAYSTVSQLGYMFMAVGAGAYTAGIFHLFTHAFFKALLFLGAGSIIYCLHHEQNLFNMGGLKTKLKTTYLTMFIATAAIAGFPPFAGFFSKDEILWSLWDKGFYIFWGMGTLTAALTSFYMFRLFFLAFAGNARSDYHCEPEPLSMKIPLLILALGSATAGFLGIPETLWGNNWIAHWLEPLFHHHSVSAEHITLSRILMGVSVGAAIVGWFTAKMFYVDQHPLKEKLKKHFQLPISVFQSKYAFDELYQEIFVQPAIQCGRVLGQFCEKYLIDGVVNAIPFVYQKIAWNLQSLQNGLVRSYAYYIIFGMMVLSYYYFLSFQPEVFY